MALADQQPLNSGFGGHTEPQEIMQGIDLSGRVAIVTGGYSGIGVETVRALADAGASVTVPARNQTKAREALADVPGDIEIAEMDLADVASVRRFADAFMADHDRLDLLINNAGVMACPESRVGPGWEMQFGTNHMGHFALTTALMPLLVKTGEETGAVRVVALSSLGHRLGGILWDDPNFTEGNYHKWQAYGQSKSANALFAVALDARLHEHGGRAFSVHPGGIMTPLQRHLDQEEMQALGWLDENGELSEMAAARFKTPAQGCATTLWAATSALLEGKGGLYCEDCDVAELVDDDNADMGHVRRFAVDPEEAERLWALSEQLLAEA